MILYLLRICLIVSSYGSCEVMVNYPYASRADCLAAFAFIKQEAPRQPPRMYCVTKEAASSI